MYVNFSPDEQFIALTIAEFAGRDTYHMIILSLKTGYYSEVENVKVIGFGVLR